MKSPLFCAAPSALFALSAIAAPALAFDSVEIRFVDGRQIPVSGLDVFVFSADGDSLTNALDSGSSVTAVGAGTQITVELPTLGSSIDVSLPQREDAVVTLAVDPLKGFTDIVSVKPTDRTPPILFSGPGPANDDCANAIPIANGNTNFDTTGATTDGFLGTNENDIWFTYTAPCNGVATFSTCDQATFDTDLAILTAASSCGNQTALAVNDDNGLCGANTSILTAPVQAGTTYLLSVGGFNAAAFGTGTLTIDCQPAPANDLCVNAQVLSVPSTVTFDNTSATTSLNDPEFSCRFSTPDQGFGTMWFQFTATSESVLIDTLQSTGSTDTLLGVYTGSCASPVEIACGEDFDFAAINFLTAIQVNGLTVGNTYNIQVASYAAGSQGSITLDLQNTPIFEPYNGSGVNVQTLTADGVGILGTDITFTVSPGFDASALYVSRMPLIFPLPPLGEVLIDPNVILSLLSFDGNHTIPLPSDPTFAGLQFFLQGINLVTLEGTNAIQMELGGF